MNNPVYIYGRNIGKEFHTCFVARSVCVCVFVCACLYVCMCVFVCVCTVRYANSLDKHCYSDGVAENLRKKYKHRLTFKLKKPLTEPLVLTSDDIYYSVLNIRQHENF